MQEQYNHKETNTTTYFTNVRKELLDLIPTDLREGNVLEIGAGTGNTLVFAKENGYAKNIYGVELCEIENSNQKNELFSEFIIGNIEEMELPFQEKTFDVILCADVLEHLIDPYTLVESLKKYLKDDGCIIASLPNIRQWKTLKRVLVYGDFRYEDSGIMDRTHLRFFTKKNMIELFEKHGYQVDKIISNQLCFTKKYNILRLPFKLIGCLYKKLFNEFYALQYHLIAYKK